jgi:DNA-binding NtrC family response regulator
MVILLVDDNDDFRSGLAENLRDDGHVVREHANPATLADSEELRDVDVVITDYHMAGQDGIALGDAVRAIRGDVPVIVVTAYWTRQLEEAALRRSFRLLRKPLDYDDLHRVLVELGGLDGGGSEGA